MSPFAPEDLISRDGFGRPVPRQPAHYLHSAGAYSRYSSRFPQGCPFIYLNHHTPSGQLRFKGATAYRWRSQPKVRRHRAASSPQGSFSNECCSSCFAGHHESINVRLSFPPAIIAILREHVESIGGLYVGKRGAY